MKKRILQVIGLIVCLVLIIVFGIESVTEHIFIEDEETPLDNTVGILLCEQTEDITVIPDKYNTGAQGELTSISSDCYFSGVKFGTTGVTGRKLDLYYQPAGTIIPDTILVENCDFSSGEFRENNVNKVTKNVTVIFRNCKFNSYVISGSGTVRRQFENCTFTHFAGGDATFTNCYFGGGTDGDGINPGVNCTFNNCMIADLIQPAQVAGDKHIDGFQIFGSSDGTNNENIVLNNCRFEVPSIPMTSPSGALNCPLSIIMRYSDANNIAFNDCYVNGGLYYAVMLLENKQKVNNLTITNMHIGGASKNLYTCDSSLDSIITSNFTETDSLYVASVRKMDDGIHLSVTNDTTKERVLSVLTKNGVEEYVIAPCYKGIELEVDSVTFADFPFDIDIVIPNTEWVACFDTTDNAKQIRFVNWSGKDVYVALDTIFPQKEQVEIEEEVVVPETDTTVVDTPNDDFVNEGTAIVNMEGSCGDNVQFLLENGVLTLKGEGTTYDYHSGNKAPWYDAKSEITELHVEEGVTKLGNQLMAECKALTKVVLPNGLTDIGTNVFKQCASIETIYIPKTLKNVGKRSFTSSVLTVEYAGSQDEWNTIVFDEYNEGLSGATINCETTLDSGVCGDAVEWKLSSAGTLVLSGSGNTYDYHSGNTPPWYGYVNQINAIVIESGITSIGNYSFRDCQNVCEVTLPETVTYVGINSFSRCKNLQTVTFTANMTAFGKNAFAGTSVIKVHYYGSVEQWAVIENNPFTQADVECKF